MTDFSFQKYSFTVTIRNNILTRNQAV